MESYTIANACGMSLTAVAYGAAVQILLVPDRTGQLRDVVLGYLNASDYASNSSYMGCVVGRTAGRIWPLRVRIGGREYDLPPITNGICHLHGGTHGLHQAIWRRVPNSRASPSAFTFICLSPDGESGYPGNLRVEVRYEVASDNRWIVEYVARSDRDTLFNPTQHTYFNLGGHSSVAIDRHTLELPSDYVVRLDDNKVADGTLISVEDMLADFRRPAQIGDRLHLMASFGLDQPYVVKRSATGGLALAARVTDPQSGICMETWTDRMVVHVYTANHFDGAMVGKGDTYYQRHAGFCLETQDFPNAVNHANFPSSILPAGIEFRSRTEYRFSVV